MDFLFLLFLQMVIFTFFFFETTLFKANCVFVSLRLCRPSSKERKPVVDGGRGHLFVCHVETKNDKSGKVAPVPCSTMAANERLGNSHP